jgi:hypothetical protein
LNGLGIGWRPGKLDQEEGAKLAKKIAAKLEA